MSASTASIDVRRVASELDTLRAAGPVSSFGVLFGILRDPADDSVTGVGFQIAGKRRTFWRARNELGTILEQGGGGMEFLDGLLHRLRIFDEDQVSFRAEWSRVLDVYRDELQKSPPRPVSRLRDAMAAMRPDAARALREILPAAPSGEGVAS